MSRTFSTVLVLGAYAGLVELVVGGPYFLLEYLGVPSDIAFICATAIFAMISLATVWHLGSKVEQLGQQLHEAEAEIARLAKQELDKRV